MSNAEHTAAVRVGKTLGRKYELTRLLGAGGMGAVYEAENLLTRRRVALKLVLSAEVDEEQVRRMLREARAASRLEHPNIVQVLDMDVDPDSGTPYMVQEFLEGEDLRRALQREGSLPAKRATDIAVAVLRALSAAHEAGVVHRDVKPENVFLARSRDGKEQVKLIDFGIARFFDNSTPEERAGQLYADASTLEKTVPGRLAGTPRYMSPEQIRAEAGIDARTDVWAVGVMLYEMLVGRHLFPGDSFGSVLSEVLTAPLVPLEEQGFEKPLSELVARALERDRRKRWDSAAAFADALEGHRPPPSPLPTPTPERPVSTPSLPRPAPRRALGAALLAAGAFFALLFAVSPWSSRRADTPPPSAPPSPTLAPVSVPPLPPVAAPSVAEAPPAPSQGASVEALLTPLTDAGHAALGASSAPPARPRSPSSPGSRARGPAEGTPRAVDASAAPVVVNGAPVVPL